MIQIERDKLYSCKKKHLSICITKTGEPLNAIAIPWSQHSSAFNMRTPDIFFCEEDLYDGEILFQLKSFTILGLYVFCALKDYNVLGNFSDLQDISLKEAHNMRDLSFMANMSDWFMLFIQGASLPNLDPLMHTEGFKKNRHSYCLGLYDYHIKDTSSLINSNLHLYELLIWNKWSKFENERWRKANALVYHYYRLDSAKN